MTTDAHRAAMRRYMARQRAADPEKYREENRHWRAANRDRIREYDRERRAADPIRTAASTAISHANRKAKRLGLPGRLRTSDVLALWERQPVCQRCRIGRGVDHVVDMTDGGANDPGNLQNLCALCNTMKQGQRKGSQTTCRQGHPLTGANVYIGPKSGQRFCRECGYRRSREYLARKKAHATACCEPMRVNVTVAKGHRVIGSRTTSPPPSTSEM